ncbi:hypothetical protein [Streptomyces sp. NPDC001286]
MLTWLAVESGVAVERRHSHCRLVEIPQGLIPMTHHVECVAILEPAAKGS